MKKIFSLFIIGVILMQISMVYAKTKLKDYNTLIIYIKNQEYKGKKFLHEDGIIYTSIKDLSKALKFDYKYDKEKSILYVSGNKYEYAFIPKGDDIYISLTAMSMYLGYYPTYNEEYNTLDISSRASSDNTLDKTYPSKLIDEARTIIYVPSGIDPNSSRKYPLIVALSPGADASGMINFWKTFAESYKLIILASKEYKNGMNMEPVISSLASNIKTLFSTLPIDKTKIIATGISGGGMGSHAFSFYYPDLISAVIINTGMMHEDFIAEKDKYPRGKLAVFLASPTDFRYNEMKRDRAFLESLGWKTNWIEFEGGHVMAPEALYHQAIRWLKDQLK